MNAKATLDPARLALLRDCLDHYDVGDADAEWPNNVVSRQTVVYHDGTIARSVDTIDHVVDTAELALCRRLAEEARRLMIGVDIGMGSETLHAPFHDFYIMARPGAADVSVIDETLIRDRFGGTLFPLVTITAEPLAEETIWWNAVKEDGAEMGADYLLPWRKMIGWFTHQAAFTSSAFVCIGDSSALSQSDPADWPLGTVLTGCCLPRLVLGLTEKRSLVGLFNQVVHT